MKSLAVNSLVPCLRLGMWMLALAGLVVGIQGADYEQAVQDLIPKLADANVSARYGAQMQLQEIAAQSSRPGQASSREALGKVLAAKAADAAVPQPARVWIIRQMEYMGRDEVVPALAQLLQDADPELRECARRALEKNPVPAASQPLRQALEKASDRAWQTGLMNSLGERRDPDAVPLIAKHLADKEVVWPATQALGKIATPAAVKALGSVAHPDWMVGEALITAASRYLDQKDHAGAQAILSQLCRQNQTPSLRAAALVLLAKADPRGVWSWIPEMLAHQDLRCQQAAVTAAQSSGIMNWDLRLANELPKVTASAKVQVLACVGPVAESAVLQAATDRDERVRLAAYEALGRMGSGKGVPVLLEAATSEDRTVRSTGETALAKIEGSGAAKALERAAQSGVPKSRAAAINALAQRQQPKAGSAMLRYASETEPGVRTAALAALGKMGTKDEFEPLTRLALNSQNPEAFAAAKSVAARLENKEPAARQVLGLIGDQEATAVQFLDVLAALGDASSLALVSKLAGGSHAEAAVQALGNWSTFAAAEPLLKMAGNSQTPTPQQQLALRGLTQLIDNSDNEPVENRAKTAVAALNAARSVEDKKQVLGVFSAVPHSSVVAVLKSLLQDEQLKTEAGTAGIAVARQLNESDRAAAADLARAIRDAAISSEITRRANFLLR